MPGGQDAAGPGSPPACWPRWACSHTGMQRRCHSHPSALHPCEQPSGKCQVISLTYFQVHFRGGSFQFSWLSCRSAVFSRKSPAQFPQPRPLRAPQPSHLRCSFQRSQVTLNAGVRGGMNHSHGPQLNHAQKRELMIVSATEARPGERPITEVLLCSPRTA